MAVQWGLQHRSLDGIESLGIDELYWRWFGPKRSQALRFICSDMWKAYPRVVAKEAAQHERKKPSSFTPAVASPSSPARVGCGSSGQRI